MPLLQVRSFPPDLHAALVQRAKADRRSVSQEVIVLLGNALADAQPEPRPRQAAVAALRRSAASRRGRGFEDPAKLIREDRER
jgi:plasmid stability protein